MEQDLRDIVKQSPSNQKYSLKNGHEDRFLKKLDAVIHRPKKRVPWFQIAATFLLLLSLGFGFQQWLVQNVVHKQKLDTNTATVAKKDFSFGDLSPQLKQVEDYYVANIQLTLSKLEVTAQTQDLVHSYMTQLEQLDIEYKNLHKELLDLGPNDQTIAALITNLQLRLDLLQKLKKKLNQLKLSKNEQTKTNIL